MTSKMQSVYLRNAGPNEKRCIIRHSLGFYSNIVVGAIYLISKHIAQESELQQLKYYAPAVTQCIQEHPLLSAVVQDANTNSPAYTRPDHLDLESHIHVHNHEKFDVRNFDIGRSDTELIRRVLEQLHNDPASQFSEVETKPAWRLDVVLLPDRIDSAYYRVLSCYTYSHSHGDGMSGIAFHKSFFKAIQTPSQMGEGPQKLTIKPPCIDLADIPDTAAKMPISLSYLLLPALGTYLPGFLTRLFGLSGSVSGADDHTWMGSKTFTDHRTPGSRVTTNVEILTITNAMLTPILQLCKKNDVKLTSFLNLAISQALSKTFKTSMTSMECYNNFICTTPVNLRKALGVPSTTIGNYGSAAYLRYDLDTIDPPVDDKLWNLLQAQGRHLVEVAKSTRNQPIGLLRFVSNFASWLQGQVGQSRGCSFETSNLGSFDPTDGLPGNSEECGINIEQVLFSQPASPVGPPVVFNVLALQGGNLNVCITWQPGVFGITQNADQESADDLRQERRFVQSISAALKERLTEVVREI